MLNNENTELTAIKKKIKKVVEEIIIEYQDEFESKFTEIEMTDVLKHKAQVSKISISDEVIENFIKSEVEDCIGVYLINKSKKKRK